MWWSEHWLLRNSQNMVWSTYRWPNEILNSTAVVPELYTETVQEIRKAMLGSHHDLAVPQHPGLRSPDKLRSSCLLWIEKSQKKNFDHLTTIGGVMTKLLKCRSSTSSQIYPVLPKHPQLGYGLHFSLGMATPSYLKDNDKQKWYKTWTCTWFWA